MATPTNPPAPLTADEIAAFRELASKATPGPWSNPIETMEEDGTRYYWIGFGVPNERGWWDRDSMMLNESDAAFIAAARNIADRLVSEWERSAEIIQRYEQEQDRTIARSISDNDLPFNSFSSVQEMNVALIRRERDELESQLAAANARDADAQAVIESTLELSRRFQAECDQLRQQLAELKQAIWDTPGDPPGNYDDMSHDDTVKQATDQSRDWVYGKAGRDQLRRQLAERDATIAELKQQLEDFD